MNIFFNKVVGHERNIERLRLLCHDDKVPHSLLFSGIDGIGKKIVAEAMAASILCHNPKDGNACGECPSCKALLSDIHPDFFRVVPEETASDFIIKIETVRALQDKIARLPILSKQRGVIIDDAQTMNDEAANCLLKTIEEPGNQIYFILITNSIMALLDTIISRCMREAFAGLSRQEVSLILTEQGVSADKAEYLASFADGSVRQAMLLNDDMGMSLHQSAVQFFSACAEKRADMEMVWREGAALARYEKKQLRQWFGFLIMILRDQLVVYTGSQVALYNQTDMLKITDYTGRLSQRQLMVMLKLAKEYQGRLRYSVSLRLMMESFIIRLIDLLED